MKRIPIALAVCLLLALGAVAVAQARSFTDVGSAFSGKTVSGGCTVVRQRQRGTATLGCPGSTGSAVARYLFALPAGCGSALRPHVDWAGAAPTVRAVSRDGTAKVSVGITGRHTVTVAMVSIAPSC